MNFEPPILQYLYRKHEIRSYFSVMDDIVEFMKAYPELSYRYYI